MKKSFRQIEGSVTAAKGFRAAGVYCNIKRMGTGTGSNKGLKRDLALIVSDVPASVAGMFTTNQVCAAPVKVCIERLRQGQGQAIVVNSGNANACTGAQGLRDARAMASLTATQLRLPVNSVFVGSTGRIGMPMPMDNVREGITAVAALLGRSPEHDRQVAEAIMTSDTHQKEVAVEFALGRKTVRLGGICKGAGMIQPGMSVDGKRPPAQPLHATMLSFVTTDAAIEPRTLQRALTQSVAQSFNRITVDGDMSTNDTVLVLANGMAANPRLTTPRRKDLATFQEALDFVTLELAKKIVRDGEGVSRFVTLHIKGARSAREADLAARAVANSSLVRTSWCGGDPNWGRILDALGYSAARIVEEKVDVAYSRAGEAKKFYSLKRGQPTATPFEDLCRVAGEKEFDLHIDLHLGSGQAVLYAADLTEEYVTFNKGDLTDPAALGG